MARYPYLSKNEPRLKAYSSLLSRLNQTENILSKIKIILIVVGTSVEVLTTGHVFPVCALGQGRLQLVDSLPCKHILNLSDFQEPMGDCPATSYPRFLFDGSDN